jgi:hypothetical protein
MSTPNSGAYRNDENPATVFVWATADAPGGRFGALRLDGKWKHASLTIGYLEENYREIKDPGEVEALLRAARTASLSWPVRD